MPIALSAANGAFRTSTSDPTAINHTPVGTPRAIVCSVIHGTSTTDHCVGITYGGVAMARVSTGIDSVTELGRADLWFLGSGIPTGTQSVSFNWATATTDDIHIAVASFTADADCEVVTVGTPIQANQANPSITLATAGRECMAVSALFSGFDALTSLAVGTGCTLINSQDGGAWSGWFERQTTASTSSFAIAVTSATDDVAYVAFNFAEIIGMAYQQGLTAGLSFAGGVAKRTNRGLAGSLSFSGGVLKLVARKLAGGLSFTGDIVKGSRRGLAGSLAFGGSLGRRTARQVGGGLSFTGSLGRQTRRTLVGSLSFAGSFTRSPIVFLRSLAGSLDFSGALVSTKVLTRALTASLSFSGALSRQAQYRRTLTAVLGLSGALSRRTARVLAGSLGFSGALTRGTARFRSFAASLSFTGQVTSSSIITKAFTAALSFGGSLSRTATYRRSLVAGLSFVTALSRGTRRSFTASLDLAGSMLWQAVAQIITGVLGVTIRKVTSRVTGGRSGPSVSGRDTSPSGDLHDVSPTTDQEE